MKCFLPSLDWGLGKLNPRPIAKPAAVTPTPAAIAAANTAFKTGIVFSLGLAKKLRATSAASHGMVTTQARKAKR